MYDKSEQHKRVSPIITRLNDRVAESSASVEDVQRQIGRGWVRDLPEDITRAINEFEKKIMLIAPSIKNSAFESEKEWRLISAGDLSGQTSRSYEIRATETGLVPYTKIPVDKFHLSGVKVGPSPRMDLNVAAARVALDLNGISEYGPIEKSSVPYRNW